MPTKKDILAELLQFCEGITPENKEYLLNTYFKYEDNPKVALICKIINALLPAHNKFMELFKENYAGQLTTLFPLILCSPNSPIELRVYPNILLDTHENVTELSEVNFAAIKTLLAKYDAEYKGPVTGLKWQDLVRYLNEFVDMPTARALTRYVFTDGKIKDNVIRDFAEILDNARKPAQLTYALTPQDFTVMYGSGPPSCMDGFSAGDRHSWQFFAEHNLSPPSWYAYYPYTKGAYITKAGKVTARAILFNNSKTAGNENEVWQFGRVYAINPEVSKQFVAALESNNIFSLKETHVPPKDFIFTVPGLAITDAKTNESRVVCPWPYFDNVQRTWGIDFNVKTNEFTIQYASKTLTPVNNRSGHIIGKDYVSLECSSCHKKLSAKNPLTPVEHGEHTFCSSNCAQVEGYITVIEGNSQKIYKKPTEEFIPLADDASMMFSTYKAAMNHGYSPLMDELMIYPEDNDIKVATLVTERIQAADGKYYGARYNIDFRTRDKAIINRVPINQLAPQKSIMFEELREAI